MKVYIIGITGDTGYRLAQALAARGDEVYGLYRKPDQAAKLATINARGTIGDLLNVQVSQLAINMSGCDAIVFCAGAGGTDGNALTDAVDGAGVTKSIAAAKLANIKRFLLVSVFPEAWRERHMDENFEHYIVVKKRAEIELTQADLDWIILRPSALKNDSGVGCVSLGVAQCHTEVCRDDVAATIAELLHASAIRRRIFELTEGDVPIAKAVAAVTSM